MKQTTRYGHPDAPTREWIYHPTRQHRRNPKDEYRVESLEEMERALARELKLSHTIKSEAHICSDHPHIHTLVLLPVIVVVFEGRKKLIGYLDLQGNSFHWGSGRAKTKSELWQIAIEYLQKRSRPGYISVQSDVMHTDISIPERNPNGDIWISVWSDNRGWWYELFIDPGHTLIHRSGPWPSKSRALSMADLESERRSSLHKKNAGSDHPSKPVTDIKHAAKQARNLYKEIVQVATKIEAVVISASHQLAQAYSLIQEESEYVGDLGYNISAAFEAQDKARRICKEADIIVDQIEFRTRYDPGFFEKHPNALPRRMCNLKKMKNKMDTLLDDAVAVLSQFNR